jgi:hypothetical protein
LYQRYSICAYISVYSNYFLGNDFSQIFSDEIQEKLIYILSSELFFNQTILPKIEEILAAIESVIPLVGVYLAKVLAFFDTIITYLNLVLAISSSWSNLSTFF